MRDIALFCFIFGLLPFVLKSPFVGVLLFTWVSLMNPHRLTYGAAYDFPFAAVIVGVTLAGLFISNKKKHFPINSLTITLMLFMLWMSFTTLFALEPARASHEWSRVIKTMSLFGVIALTINSKKEIQAFAWVVGLSIGFFGFKGGLFTILTGGNSHVYGPEGSYISDNNALALAMITAAPIIWYLWMSEKRMLIKLPLLMLTLLTTLSVVGSYSRGAILGGAVMLLFLILKSKNKFGTGVALVIIVPVALMTMPEQWFDRMHSIDNYATDLSALGRINAWRFAINLASTHILGGGFECFTNRQFLAYAPDPYNQHAAHSIYFQVLGEHGFVGLGLFLLFAVLAWRTGTRIAQFCKGHKELEWASSLAAMCQVSMIGFLVGGAFLTLAYYDLFYDIVAVLVVLEKFLLSSKNTPAAAAADTPASILINPPQET